MDFCHVVFKMSGEVKPKTSAKQMILMLSFACSHIEVVFPETTHGKAL